MKQSERKAHKKALTKRQKQRRKEKRANQTAQTAPQPAAQPATKEVMETTTETKQDEIFSTEEVRNALRGALETVLRVKRMVDKAIEAVSEDDANKVFAASVTAQRRRDDLFDVRRDEKTVIRVHPLFALWKLGERCAKQVETLLRLTSPKEFAQWKAEADKAAKDAAKLEESAQKAAA